MACIVDRCTPGLLDPPLLLALPLRHTETMTKDPLPPPTPTHSSTGCPTLFPADISTAVDAEAVAAKDLKKKQMGREIADEDHD